MEANILLWIQDNLRFSWLNSSMKAITQLGDLAILWIVFMIVLLLDKRTRKIAYTMIVGLLVCVVVNNVILKNLVGRTRPYEVISSLHLIIPKEKDLSFPSAHSGVAFAMATILAGTTPKKYGIFAFVIAGLIAFSRLYVGVHYPTDVVCGLIDGVLIGLALLKLDLFHIKQQNTI